MQVHTRPEVPVEGVEVAVEEEHALLHSPAPEQPAQVHERVLGQHNHHQDRLRVHCQLNVKKNSIFKFMLLKFL